MAYQLIELDDKDSIATITINTPPANTLSSASIKELRSAVRVMNESEHIHAIIITGKGRFFAAGADIKEFVPALGDDAQGLALSKAGQALCDEVEKCRKPVIAAINGPALGGGFELALGCHFRIAADDAIVGLPELNLGLIPSFGGTQRLSRLTTQATALDIILTGRQIKMKEALSLGLIQQAVPADELIQAATYLAHSYIDGNSMESVQRAIQCVMQGYQEPITDGLERESKKFAELFLTHDAKEGVHAFVEKRKAVFKHE
ncbi:enoyl-CoA hydratase-related protein [Virgibacillus halophilus]|uniref:Enoyl-CoA hydratase-related protein n=1 Tax=Tigheibacillus halophilus TaxID=361280 RepID=A0ABU5C8K9_9BACI|nr:enoyl-CoA hydratase-related protein [Virgibacillus halophilus]